MHCATEGVATCDEPYSKGVEMAALSVKYGTVTRLAAWQDLIWLPSVQNLVSV